MEEEEGSSSQGRAGYISNSASSSGIDYKRIPQIDRTTLGWMTSVNEELNIPLDNEELQKVKNLQKKSLTHRISIQRTNWLYFWSGGFDIYLLQTSHLKKVEDYVKKMELFRKKFFSCEEKMINDNKMGNYDNNWIFDELNMNRCEKEIENLQKIENNQNNQNDNEKMNNDDKMDDNMGETNNNNDNNNEKNNINNNENNSEKTDIKYQLEKNQIEKELLKEMAEIKELEIQINELREKFNGRMKFLNSIWDETDFFSPFETINSSSLRLNSCLKERTYIIRLSSTVCGNITITKRTSSNVLHRRLPIVGDRIYDAEYLSVIRNHSDNAHGYYETGSNVLHYIRKF